MLRNQRPALDTFGIGYAMPVSYDKRTAIAGTASEQSIPSRELSIVHCLALRIPSDGNRPLPH